MILKLLIRDPAGLALVVIPFVAAAVLLLLGSTKAFRVRVLEGEVASRRHSFVAAWKADPAPTTENLVAIRNQVDHLRDQLNRALTPFFGDESERVRDRPQVEPEDLFFEIIDYTERVSMLATDRKIRFSSDLKFGFGDIVRDGRIPLEGLSAARRSETIGTLQSQLRLLEHLMELLLTACPDRVVNIRRAVYAEDERQHWRREAEVFVDESFGSRKLPDWLTVTSVEITFEGQTGVLRSVLNSMVDLKIAAIPRELKVEPVTEASIGAPSRRNRRPVGVGSGPFDGVSVGNSASLDNREKELIPIIDQNVSQFCLLIDLYEVQSSAMNQENLDPVEVYR